jgi:hypothetical protein
MQNNIKGVQPLVNLAGIAVGNGFVAPPEMSSGYADEIYNAGLISWEDYGVAQSYVANITSAINNKDFVGAYLIWDAFLNGDATPGGAWFNNVTGGVNYYSFAVFVVCLCLLVLWLTCVFVQISPRRWRRP